VTGVETWHRTQLPAVVWENRKAANVLKSGLLAADSVAVYIPLNTLAGYVSPVAFKALVTKTGFWTLDIGDYLVKGLITTEMVGAVTATTLKASHDDVVQIRSIDKKDVGSVSMHHWQIGAN
jgi:hypothetical protein